MSDATPTLRMFAKYDCYPLWVSLSDGGEDNPDPHDLGRRVARSVAGRYTVTYYDQRQPSAVTVTG